MSITFNANEIFEMAEEIERNAAKFYRKAAEITSGKDTKDFLFGMAAMEEIHLVIFQEMREELAGLKMASDIFDPDNEAALYLQTMADSHGSEGKKNLREELTGEESMREILEAAVRGEKNSVVFYSGLKELVLAQAGKEKVETIIKEELGHIHTLTEKLKTLN